MLQINRCALTICFDNGEIGTYSAGFPNFTIKYSEIMDLVDTDGRLWKAIHLKQ